VEGFAETLRYLKGFQTVFGGKHTVACGFQEFASKFTDFALQIMLPPNPNPQPTLQALLPEQQQPGMVAAPPTDPDDDCVLADSSDLPGTGAHSKPILRIGLMVLGVGIALVFGATYWRRHAPTGLWFNLP